MRIYVAPSSAPTPTFRKTNITRKSSIKAVKELKRLLNNTYSEESPILVAREDLVVFNRLIDWAFNSPSEVNAGSPSSPTVDGDDANSTEV